jgi:hypothetical protein
MLLPTQVAASAAITDSMQSMLDTIEERRKAAEEKKTGQKKDPLLEARISNSTEAKRAQGRIAEALFGMNKVDINELKIQLLDKLGEKLGINREDGMYSYAYGRAIEGALKSVGTSALDDLSKELGLEELDLSLTDLVAAIKNPWGDENDRLEKALDKQHGDGKTTTDERAKILQRLDDVSDPKTLEELKLGAQYSDPTRVEDDETNAERLDDIKAKEASEKLDDVKDRQDAINERHQENQTPGNTNGATVDPANIDDVLMLSLTAQAETDKQTQDVSQHDQQAEAGVEGQGSTAALAGAETPDILQAAEEETDADGQTLSASTQVDDIGIYDILKRRHFSTPG